MTTHSTQTNEQRERAELIRHMVDRFLAWKLPKDFYPDSFISFDREKHGTWGGYPNSWPTGTNLFTAEQAKQMLEYLLDGYEPQQKESDNRPSRDWYGRLFAEILDDDIQIGPHQASALLEAFAQREQQALSKQNDYRWERVPDPDFSNFKKWQELPSDDLYIYHRAPDMSWLRLKKPQGCYFPDSDAQRPALKPLTAEMVVAGARELCRIQAGECGTDADDEWAIYSDQFKRDARACLEAAHGIKEQS